MYTPVKVSVASGQHEKLKAAIAEQKAVSIKINLRNVVGENPQVVLLTRGQIAKLEKAKTTRRSSKAIRLSRRQVQANVSHTFRFPLYDVSVFIHFHFFAIFYDKKTTFFRIDLKIFQYCIG